MPGRYACLGRSLVGEKRDLRAVVAKDGFARVSGRKGDRVEMVEVVLDAPNSAKFVLRVANAAGSIRECDVVAAAVELRDGEEVAAELRNM